MNELLQDANFNVKHITYFPHISRSYAVLIVCPSIRVNLRAV
jgi:hypothetical protein